MSTRVRLARNLVEHPFLTKATKKQRRQIETILRERLQASDLGAVGESQGVIAYVPIDEIE